MVQAFKHIIHGSSTLDNLAANLNKSHNRTSEIVAELTKEGFVDRQRQGRAVSFHVGATEHARKLKNLMIARQTIAFEDIITDSKLLFLAAIAQDWMMLRAAAKLVGVNQRMIYNYKQKFLHRGIITCKKNLYTVQQWPLLREFLLAYRKYNTINGHVHWQFQNEVLFSVDREELIQGTPTGLYKYEDYGVKMGVILALCVFPKRKVAKEEIFVHSLFEVNDPRTLHVALTFYLKNKLKEKKVMPLAMKYGKYTMFTQFLKVLATDEKKLKLGELPMFERSDFKRIAKMYELYSATMY
tara:strand:- start:1224 stop:2117 length:894 start_codon:yes stop_codon:yes gene_type:complete